MEEPQSQKDEHTDDLKFQFEYDEFGVEQYLLPIEGYTAEYMESEIK